MVQDFVGAGVTMAKRGKVKSPSKCNSEAE